MYQVGDRVTVVGGNDDPDDYGSRYVAPFIGCSGTVLHYLPDGDLWLVRVRRARRSRKVGWRSRTRDRYRATREAFCTEELSPC